ncbi:DUF7006 family protein [Enterococcus termitis]|uniref:Uncharacterized protein n=1 Tax=Enterococcus termitis TaxID=332950 RepID=A0A1E5GJA7_9ENTE|nr:hypothetical protein [Enterococcus termitis]OEG12803.1 hypothetical protein BCR25_19370 [Enterococcus termitis]
MDMKDSIVRELDSFASQNDILRYSDLYEVYLDLRRSIECIFLLKSDKNAVETTLHCLKIESKVQLFIFYLKQVKNGELKEYEAVKAISDDYEVYCMEMINTDLIGDISIFFKKNKEAEES